MENVLPDKFSAFIRVALDDLKAVENDPRYRIHMSTWHTPRTETGPEIGVCWVCLAGAAMARRLHADPSRKYTPAAFPSYALKLVALDHLVCGNIHEAYGCFANAFIDTGSDSELESVMKRYWTNKTPRYEIEPDEFFRHFYEMANDFEKIGL